MLVSITNQNGQNKSIPKAKMEAYAYQRRNLISGVSHERKRSHVPPAGLATTDRTDRWRSLCRLAFRGTHCGRPLAQRRQPIARAGRIRFDRAPERTYVEGHRCA